MMTQPDKLYRCLYMSHGGGPMPLLGDPGHKEMLEFCRTIAPQLGQPKAIVVISAHWEEQVATLIGSPSPSLLYDYYGFPPESYEITYPAPGAPELAQEIADLLQGHNIACAFDNQRGFDHGLFVPLKLLFPKADIPCLQLSLLKSMNPEQHLKLGEALSKLIDQDVLILGSGFSFHNMQGFFNARAQCDAANQAFENWLQPLMADTDLTEAERRQALVQWSQAPGARLCHPREEHLLPLHVCYGAVNRPAAKVYDMTVLGRRCCAVAW